MSGFFKRVDVNHDGKFDFKDVELVGTDIVIVLKKGTALVKLVFPFLQLAGVNVASLNATLALVDNALDLSSSIFENIGVLKLPKSLADLKDLGDIDQNGEIDIDDAIAYVHMNKATIEKAIRVCHDLHKDVSLLEKANQHLQTLHNTLVELKKHQIAQPAMAAIA